MEKIIFECEVITPMFCGGPKGDDAEIRGSSIKGLMRFWWRAFNAHKYKSISDLKSAEGEIFGSTEEKKEKRSSFKIKITMINVITGKKNEKLPFYKMSATHKGKQRNANALDYLAYGISVYDKDSRGSLINRSYLKPSTKFNVELILQDNNYKEDVINSFLFLAYFGGIGAKSRNGFGKINITNFNNSSQNNDLEFKNIIKKIEPIKKLSNGIINFPNFNKEVRLFQLKKPEKNWTNALGKLGVIYRDARLSLEKLHSYNKRQYVAAPIIVNKKEESILKRHSKQFFLIVNKKGPAFYSYILCLFSSEYYSGKNKDDLHSNIKMQKIDNKVYLETWDNMVNYFKNKTNGVLEELL